MPTRRAPRIYYGGYPGAAALIRDPLVWRRYVRDSLIETALARDVPALERITKPALLRNLFGLACRFPAQTLSYNKMLGQLQNAGNATTLAHYLGLLGRAFLVSGLERYSPGGARSRGSTPKLVVWNNALVGALSPMSFHEAKDDPTWWGHLTENAVGAYLVDLAWERGWELFWWREGDTEVDYVVRSGHRLAAIEVKSGRARDLRASRGLAAFQRAYPQARDLVCGSGGLPLDELFDRSSADMLLGS